MRRCNDIPFEDRTINQAYRCIATSKFQTNIMSIPTLLKNHFKVQASENKLEIEQQGKTIPMEKSSDGKIFLSHRKENTKGTNKYILQKEYNGQKLSTRFIQPYE